MEFHNSFMMKANTGTISKITIPVYSMEPSIRKTSAEIIKEARETIKETKCFNENPYKSMSVKPVNTQRPFTPKDKQRILFGKSVKSSRPPSAFSLRYLRFQNPESKNKKGSTESENADNSKPKFLRNNSATENKSYNVFNLPVEEKPIGKITLPSIQCPSVKTLFNKNKFLQGNSLENLPEEHETLTEPVSQIAQRNVHSSPNENTDINNEVKKISRTNSDSFILEPCNLESIFPNKQIIYDSENLFTKNHFERQLKKNEILTEKQTTEKPIKKILEDLKNNNDSDETLKHLNYLYETIILGQTNVEGQKISSKLKIHILKCLYGFVESQNETILLTIARIILTLKVTGSNLSGVCKLIFKVSRNDKNDNLFIDNNLLELFLEALGSATPLEDTEALIYGYGAVKFLTMNPILTAKILNQGILELTILHVKIINTAKLEKSQIPDQANHVLFQITGVLRNILCEEMIYNNFIECGAMKEMCTSLELFAADVDIIGNISRILSITSTYDHCCEFMINHNNIYHVFIKLFEKYPGKQEIVVRLGYILGNLVAKSDYAREQLFSAKHSIEYIINVINIYLAKDLKNTENGLTIQVKEISNSPEGSSGSVEDVIIKMIRILANIAIDPEVGTGLIEKYGIKLITICMTLLLRKSVDESEELILSILSTLNNLSYYYTPDESNAFHQKQLELSNELCRMLNLNNRDCCMESIRVLGNLSRSKISRDFITETGSFLKLIKFLQNDDLELLKTTVGVLVNMMADKDNRSTFKKEKGLSEILRVFAHSGQNDWALSTLICQVVWNFIIDSDNLNDYITDMELNHILELLVDYLDEEQLFGINEENVADDSIIHSHEYILWEEFASVATNLLEKIEQFIDKSTSEQNDSNSDDNDVYIGTTKEFPVQKSSSCNKFNFTTW